MVGDDHVGLARGAFGPFDEAASVMWAGRIDALAAPIGEAQALRRQLPPGVLAAVVQKAHEPGRKISARHVAVAAVARPARDKAGGERGFGVAGGQLAEDLLHVEQAQIVFTALANDDALAPLVGIGNRRAVSCSSCRCRFFV